MRLALNNESTMMFGHERMMQLIAEYEIWLTENEVWYNLCNYDRWGKPYNIDMNETDAIIFKLRFGL